jgi:hypothetical protein
LLGALNFSLTHKPKQTTTQALLQALKTSGIWEQCNAQIGDEANLHILLFSFLHPLCFIMIFISYYSKTNHVCPPIGRTLWITLFSKQEPKVLHKSKELLETIIFYIYS